MLTTPSFNIKLDFVFKDMRVRQCVCSAAAVTVIEPKIKRKEGDSNAGKDPYDFGRAVQL